MNVDVKVRCINNNNTQGLTKGKLYRVIDGDNEYVGITNDNGIVGYYQRRRFNNVVV